METFAWYVGHMVFAIIAVYVVVRLATIAHYRTRAEYDDKRRVKDFLSNNNGDDDAER